MVKHMIIWKIKEDCDNKEAVKENVKRELEALNGRVASIIRTPFFTGGFPPILR